MPECDCGCEPDEAAREYDATELLEINIPECRKVLDTIKLEQRVKLRDKKYPHEGSDGDPLMGFEMGHWVAKVDVEVNGTWTCATSACIAGWAVVLDGASEVKDYDETGQADWCKVKVKDGYENQLIEDRAQEIMGLPSTIANDLFYVDENDDAVEVLESVIEQAEKAQYEALRAR